MRNFIFSFFLNISQSDYSTGGISQNISSGLFFRIFLIFFIFLSDLLVQILYQLLKLEFVSIKKDFSIPLLWNRPKGPPSRKTEWKSLCLFFLFFTGENSLDETEITKNILSAKYLYFTSRLFPVFSLGCSIPISSIRVGTMSARQPPSLSL